MNAREQGFLLLTSPLGNPERKPLTVAQFRTLAQRARQMEKPEVQRDMTPSDLVALGYDHATAQQILTLLAQTDHLRWYLEKAWQQDCYPITRISQCYPPQLRKRLGMDCPGSLWAKGDMTLLQNKAVALVGSRELRQENLTFAREAGRQIAMQGFSLVSGNARGADREAQEACLATGGTVISVVADSLEKCPLRENVLFLSEDGFNAAFTPQRALSRNRVIHCLGMLTLVAQSDLKKGGTWDGCMRNLRHAWTPICGYDDRSPAMQALFDCGVQPVTIKQLSNIPALLPKQDTFFDQ